MDECREWINELFGRRLNSVIQPRGSNKRMHKWRKEFRSRLQHREVLRISWALRGVIESVDSILAIIIETSYNVATML